MQYKIKIKDGKPVGTVINNTAKIYFDFNAPVITNTTTNTITINTAMPSAIANPQFAIYPNPATNTLHINTNLTGAVQYQIYNALGALVQTNKTTAPNFTTDISSLASGIYFLKLKTETAEAVTRFIKQ